MNTSLKSFALIAALIAPLSSAYAQDSWTGNANDGLWTSNANWSTGTVPGASDDAQIAITATVTLPAGNTTVFLLELENSPISLTGVATTAFTTDFFGVFQGASGTLTLLSGNTFTATSNENIVGAGSLGTGTFTVAGNGAVSFTDTTAPLFVGTGTTGVMNQTGGTVSATGRVFVGSDGTVSFFSNNTSGTGVYNLSGTSTFTAGSLYLGASSGNTAATSTGTFTMTGGIVTINNAVALGVSTAGEAVNGDSGVITQSAGSFTAGTLEVGESTGGSGSYSLSGSGTFVATSVVLGDETGATGTFSQSGGIGTYGTLTVGNNGTGTFSLSGGTDTASGGVFLGNNAGSNGMMTQSNGTLTTSDVSVGGFGSGDYKLSGGELLINGGGQLDIATSSGNGSFTLSGTGDLDVANGVFVGGSTGTGVFTYQGGTIENDTPISVSNNGTFNQEANFTPSTANPVTLFSGATYNLNSGTLTIGGDMGTPGSSGIFGAAGAIFNFNGGTVAPTGTDWTDALAGSVNGNSTIDTTANNAILNGSLTGSGLITITGNNAVDLNLTLGNSSAASFGFHIMSGSLFANAATFPSSGAITIDSTGTANIAEHGTNTLSGPISGAGAFKVNFDDNTDVLKLTGATNLSGVTTLTTTTGLGTLEVANGSLGQITGTGAVTIGGPASSGVVTFTNGTNNYTGATTINSGYTLYASSLQGGGTVTNNGTLGVEGAGHSTGSGVLNISGPFVSTGDILIGMNSTPSTDLIAVNNTANVTGSTFTLVNAQAVTGTFTILTSTGLTANNTTLASNLFVHASIAPDTVNPNNLDLLTSTTTSSGIAGLNLTPNQQAAATAIDPLIGNNNLSGNQQANLSQLLNLIGSSGTTPGQLAKNYEQLTPESLQYAQAIAYEHSTFLVTKADAFDDALHHEFSGFDTGGVTITLPGFNSGLGREMQSMLAYDPSSWHNTAPNGVNYYPDDGSGSATGATMTPASPEPGEVMSDSPTTAPMPVRTEPHSVVLRKPYSNFSAFIGGDGTIADLNQDQGASYAPSSKASYSAVDAIAGVSYRMTNNLAAGVLMDYSHTDATTDSYGSKTKVDTYSPGVFATYGDKGFYVNGLFSYGRNNYSNNREVPVVGGIANSSPDGNQYTGALDAGYQLNLGRGLTVTPSGGLTYTHLDIDSFTETGAAPANLSVDAQHDDSLRSRLGASVNYLTGIGRITLIPTFSAMWQHEFLDENAPITSSFNDLSSGAFTIHSVSMGRDSALISVGLTAQLDNSMAVFLEANADVNENYNAENFVGGFKGSF